ncbi:MAG: 3-dehydroquinate dehydratase [Ignavibacteriae bacterium]|nr:3-dehydroquinate dehydratase [Ignavibacteriota bacterium]
MKILVLNGPNLNKLGKRDESQYGKLTLENIKAKLKVEYPSDIFTFYQSNLEGELVNWIQGASKYDGLIINPGGYTHTSVAIKDALELIQIPKIEVHLSNLSSREDFRQKQITTGSCNGYISGFREHGYLAAVYLLKKLTKI